MKVINITSEKLIFEDGSELYSHHDQNCCESHYLSFDDLTLQDFDGLEFNLDGDDFFKKITDYGIELMPINGHPIRIPGYARNNGYYSSNLFLELKRGDELKSYDIEECQIWEY